MAHIHRLFGSAFLIRPDGLVMTAAHVLKDAFASAAENNQKVAFVGKDENGQAEKNVVAEITAWDCAPEPIDIAVAISIYQSKTTYKLSKKTYDTLLWRDVASIGYPINAWSIVDKKHRINLRCHKGYVQRHIASGDLGRPTPESFELSFLGSRGMSGAPVFLYQGDHDEVLGVFVGAFRSEIVEEVLEEITEGSKTYTEKRVKVDEYGIAHAISALRGWVPSFMVDALI
ncbi:S1 family peptidase [Glycocaulis sp.]|uniref:S1 family peptidase n=1 Tax=Glycocaulis sp. TaxID=1969725 RepID=UPI003D206BAB